MQTLSPPMKLADLQMGDKFYFDQDVQQSTFHPMTTQWEFHGPGRRGTYWIAQLDQTRQFAEKPMSENTGEILVRRISY